MRITQILNMLIVAVLCASGSYALTADEIMKKVDARETGKTQISTATMTLINKKKQERVRKLKLFSKKFLK